MAWFHSLRVQERKGTERFALSSIQGRDGYNMLWALSFCIPDGGQVSHVHLSKQLHTIGCHDVGHYSASMMA